MRVKFSQVTTLPTDRPRTKVQRFSAPERKHNYDSKGKEIEVPIKLPDPTKQNTLIFNVINDAGTVREKTVMALGNQVLFSDWQRRQFTKVLMERLEQFGQVAFEPNSHANVLINSLGAKVKGNGIVLEHHPQLPIVSPSPQQIPFRKNHITASDIFKYYNCKHLVWRDIHLPKPDVEPNAFLTLLREKGVKHEENVIEHLGDYVDLGTGDKNERFLATISAMKSKVPLIYHGFLIGKDVRGEPDLLVLRQDGTYMPVDIKAAMAYEGAEEYSKETGKLKEYYAMQLAVYVEALQELGFTTENKGAILDIERNWVDYDLNAPKNTKDKRSWWEIYQEETKPAVLELVRGEKYVESALCSFCFVCDHHDACKEECTQRRDLTLVHGLGPSRKEAIQKDTELKTIDDLANVDLIELLDRKQDEGADFLRGIGEKHLIEWIRRAKNLIVEKEMKILAPFSIPKSDRELHFDLEGDPTQNIIYLFGVTEKNNQTGESKYHGFYAKDVTPEAEEQAFKEFWDYVRSLPDDYITYHYSHYERTWCRKLQERYPNAVTEEEVERFFAPERCVDLYRLVEDYTDWPVKSYGLKSINKFSGFKWRDKHPSGTESIRWFNDWLDSGKQPELLERILIYNEDDCNATVFLKDLLEKKLEEYNLAKEESEKREPEEYNSVKGKEEEQKRELLSHLIAGVISSKQVNIVNI